MNDLEFRCIGADLPLFCTACGLVEGHPVHHGHYSEFVGEKIHAHKFKGGTNGPHNRPSAQQG